MLCYHRKRGDRTTRRQPPKVGRDREASWKRQQQAREEQPHAPARIPVCVNQIPGYSSRRVVSQMVERRGELVCLSHTHTLSPLSLTRPLAVHSCLQAASPLNQRREQQPPSPSTSCASSAHSPSYQPPAGGPAKPVISIHHPCLRRRIPSCSMTVGARGSLSPEA